MSAIDPFVSDPSEDDLVRKKVIFTAPTLRPTAFTPDSSTDIGESFVFAIAYENRNPSTCDRKERLFLPVNPETFGWSNTRAIGTYDLLNGPQATQLGNMQLRVFHFQSFFPMLYEDDFCVPWPPPRFVTVPGYTGQIRVPDGRTPQEAVTWITNCMRAGMPLVLWAVPLRRAASIYPNTKVVISGFNPSYTAGNPMDVFFELELTELVEPTIIRTATTTPKAAHGPTWADKGKFKNHKYVTAHGDTLISIARAAYGTPYGGLWGQIKAKNVWVYYPKHVRHHLRNNHGKLKPLNGTTSLLKGQHLVIPKPKSKPR